MKLHLLFIRTEMLSSKYLIPYCVSLLCVLLHLTVFFNILILSLFARFVYILNEYCYKIKLCPCITSASCSRLCYCALLYGHLPQMLHITFLLFFVTLGPLRCA